MVAARNEAKRKLDEEYRKKILRKNSMQKCVYAEKKNFSNFFLSLLISLNLFQINNEEQTSEVPKWEDIQHKSSPSQSHKFKKSLRENNIQVIPSRESPILKPTAEACAGKYFHRNIIIPLHRVI